MSNPGTNRRLATILFADIDGYSRMMRADEEQTLVDLRAHLAELVRPVVERFHGRIVKTVGDGVLVEFGSAVEAIRSAVELQRGMFERNVGTPPERRQAFRIGLHLGDIIAFDEDVFGDTVNVAARLQGQAEPGSIVLSDSVYEQVRDKLALPFRDLGRRTVKNIERPIRMYSLDAATLSETDRAAGASQRTLRGPPARRPWWRAAWSSQQSHWPRPLPIGRADRHRSMSQALWADRRPKAACRLPSSSSPTKAAIPPRTTFPTGSPRTSRGRSAVSSSSPFSLTAPCCPSVARRCRCRRSARR